MSGLAAAALALVGTRFRLNGRDPGSGLDCLGVVAASLAAVGRPAPLPRQFSLRCRGEPDVEALVAPTGLVPACGAVAAGDVLLVRCSPVQLHLLVATAPDRYVHAHAGLRRVVLGPRDPAWAVARHWRLPDNR